MKSRSFRPRTLAAAIAALVAASGLSADRSFAGSPVTTDEFGTTGPNAVVGPPAQGIARYIVRFAEQPLALYNSVVASKPINGISSIPFKTMSNGRTRLDVHSTQAKNYVQYLKQQQTQHLSDIATALGHSAKVTLTMQSALNAAIIVMSAQDALKVAKVPGVVAVERDRPQPLATDIGPGFIGATSVWWGTPAGQDTIFANGFENNVGFRGDGIVIGDIDTGYNSSSPSFQATDANGYTITNPLGTGNFIGQCGVAGISTAGCNDKVIGVYDEINLTGGGPPFSVEDTQGHGSHTASTAGGDQRSATLSGYTAPISGVAPHANLVIYYACSPDPAVQCSTAATSASVDQAIQDGVVDALNYSISGGSDPWNDTTSLAFLSATDAGIFIAAAAGNTSASVPAQLPGTANHAEPWVTTVAAGTHTGGAIVNLLSVTGPGTPPANTQNLNIEEGGGSAYTGGFSVAIPPTTPLILSPNFRAIDKTGSDGCTAYAPNQFLNAIALISRGTCAFATKATNAQAAGAVAIVISDNRPEALFSPSLGTAAITKPVWIIGQTDGLNLQTFLLANSGVTAQVPYFGMRLPTQPDVLAGFSLLGPATIDVIKPDVQAPGVNILAAIANDGSLNGPNLVALYNGTSMATPHTTGSGALMMGVHPDWTPAEAKSALMMTAKEVGLTKANGTTPSDFFDRGSGRLQDFLASKAGLVLNETGLNFNNANPALGGDPAKLNIPSMQSRNCVTVTGPTTSTPTCTFARKVRSTQNHTVTWTASVTGITGTVSPATFAVVANGSRPISVNVDASAYTSDGSFHFGEVVLTPDDATLPALHMTVAVTLQPPTISTPATLAANIPAGMTTTSVTLPVTNTGGPTLNVTNTNFVDPIAKYGYVDVDQPSQGNNGYYNTFFTDLGTGSYAADDFTVSAGTNLSKIVVPGFVTSATQLSGVPGNLIHFQIFGNAAGLPNGDPEGITSATLPVYSFNATIGTTPGLSVAGNTISLNLVTAGAPPTNLPAGTYWLVVHVDMTLAQGWAQFVTTANTGFTGAEFGPVFGETNWALITDAPGFAMHIEQQVACGAAWMTTSPATMSIPSQITEPLTVTVNSALFPGPVSSATGYLCLQSNDAKQPIRAVQVTATQL